MQRESDLFITSMITDRIGLHKVLLPINHKNNNKNYIKERENLHLKTDKGGVNCFMSLSN